LETATSPLYTPSSVLFFAFANCKHRRTNFAAYRKHHSRSEGRDCKIEPGGPVVGGYTYNTYKGAESSTKEHGATETHNVGGGQEKNRSGTAGTLGKNQGSKEKLAGNIRIRKANNYLVTLSNSLPETCRPNMAAVAGNKNGTG
jgi:hypothetical protein